MEKSPNKFVGSGEGGFRQILDNPKQVFITEKSNYDTVNRSSLVGGGPCGITRAKEEFLSAMYAFPMQKGSPYTKLFSVA